MTSILETHKAGYDMISIVLCKIKQMFEINMLFILHALFIFLLFIFFRQSTPESWAEFSHDNIVRAEHEKMASQELRKLIDQILTDTSNDMREQCNTVNTEFAKRIEEMNDAKTKMENHLHKVRSSQTCMICKESVQTVPQINW